MTPSQQRTVSSAKLFDVATEHSWVENHVFLAMVTGVLLLVVGFTHGPTNPIICNNNGRFCYYQRTDHYVGEPSSID